MKIVGCLAICALIYIGGYVAFRKTHSYVDTVSGRTDTVISWDRTVDGLLYYTFMPPLLIDRALLGRNFVVV